MPGLFAAPLADFLAPEFGTAGVNLTAKDANGDRRAEVILGSGPGATPRGRIYSNLTPGTPPNVADLPLELLRATADGMVVG